MWHIWHRSYMYMYMQQPNNNTTKSKRVLARHHLRSVLRLHLTSEAPVAVVMGSVSAPGGAPQPLGTRWLGVPACTMHRHVRTCTYGTGTGLVLKRRQVSAAGPGADSPCPAMDPCLVARSSTGAKGQALLRCESSMQNWHWGIDRDLPVKVWP